MSKCDNCIKKTNSLRAWPSNGGEFMLVCPDCWKILNDAESKSKKDY